MNSLVSELSTVLNKIALSAIINSRTSYTIVGKEPLKKLTPPKLLNSPEYYKSSHYLQSKYINVEILLSADDNDETVNTILNKIKDTCYILSSVIYKTANVSKLGQGIIQIENILRKYGYNLYLGEQNNKPLLISDVFNETIPFSYHKYIFHTHSNIVNGRREDSVGIKIYNTQTHNIIFVSALYITYKLNPMVATATPGFAPHLSEKQVNIENPIYFNTEHWKSQHSPTEINQIVSYLYTNNYPSIPSLIYRLVTEYNHGYGPYMSERPLINRENIKTQIDYILKLLNNNEINSQYTNDIIFGKEKDFRHFLKYLQNQYPNSPCFDFKTNTNIVDASQMANTSIKTIKLNMKRDKTSYIENKEMETILHSFHDLKNPIGKMLNEYILKFGYNSIINEYTNRSANYSTNIISWLYTGNIKFLQKYIKPELSDDLIPTIQFHQKFVNLFNGLNKPLYTNEFSKHLPETYILYKGVSLFNCKSSNGKYLDFLNLDLSVPNYIYNPVPTSTSSIMHISEEFARNECCILRIKMHHKYSVLFIPANDKYSRYTFQNEVILPPKSVFLITNVQYIYRKQIGISEYNDGTDMVLLIDCEYKYIESGDELPGFAPDVHEIPDAASVPDVKPVEKVVTLNKEFYNKHKYIDKPYFVYLAKKQMNSRLTEYENKLIADAAKHYMKEYLAIMTNKYENDNEKPNMNSPELPYKKMPIIPEPRQTSSIPEVQFSLPSKIESIKPLSDDGASKPLSMEMDIGNGEPSTSVMPPVNTASSTKKTSYAGNKKSHGHRHHKTDASSVSAAPSVEVSSSKQSIGKHRGSKKPMKGGKLSIHSRPGTMKRLMFIENNERTKSAVTFTVIFDDMFADSCCESAIAGNENIAEALSTMAEAYFDPSKVKLDSMARHKAIELEKDYNRHKHAIAGYVKNHPDYKYMLNEQSIQKLAEFYEDIKSVGSTSIPKSHKTIKNTVSLQSHKPVKSKKINTQLLNTMHTMPIVSAY